MSKTPNPYGSLLGTRNPQDVVADTPKRLRELSLVLSGVKAERSYAPGKWTATEILAHLADCEIAFGFRLRQAAAEENHLIQPFNQDAWAKNYRTADAAQAVDVFCALRGWNVAFLKSQPPEVMAKAVAHPERGAMTFGTLVQTMAGHDLNHLAQLETIAGQG